mmetsp:Transcript_3903/g.13830  ORF Transcript_3903/g.13830 Transcript_3903/m.13830 type:complete len:209 (+) Transcript_3903:947-1573(+)
MLLATAQLLGAVKEELLCPVEGAIHADVLAENEADVSVQRSSRVVHNSASLPHGERAEGKVHDNVPLQLRKWRPLRLRVTSVTHAARELLAGAEVVQLCKDAEDHLHGSCVVRAVGGVLRGHALEPVLHERREHLAAECAVAPPVRARHGSRLLLPRAAVDVPAELAPRQACRLVFAVLAQRQVPLPRWQAHAPRLQGLGLLHVVVLL